MDGLNGLTSPSFGEVAPGSWFPDFLDVSPFKWRSPLQRGADQTKCLWEEQFGGWLVGGGSRHLFQGVVEMMILLWDFSSICLLLCVCVFFSFSLTLQYFSKISFYAYIYIEIFYVYIYIYLYVKKFNCKYSTCNVALWPVRCLCLTRSSLFWT